jgi:sugar (pentulose or hexulose) kinase
VLHQADWILGKLSGRYGISDTNNCLKLGFDPLNGRWPDWLGHTGAFREWFPKVYQPGTPVAMISHEMAEKFGLNPNTQLVAGTTDSTAAIIATGATQPGEAVTSLGSTLVMKIITTMPVFDPKYGIYSQPLGPLWLVGGGSNSGGRVLRHFFDNQQLEQLSQQIDPQQPSGLDYYPLLTPGERFPVCDPRLEPKLTPRPESDVEFLHGLFEGMAKIEHQAYQRLAELGTPYPTSIRSAGGGAANPVWTAIRQRILGVPVIKADHQEAAYGSALLAMKAITGIQTHV